jgi:hypothetical protein
VIAPVHARSVDDVVELLDALGLERVGLLGVGPQRTLAARVVAAHPLRIGRVGILDHREPSVDSTAVIEWLAQP